jgi:peptidoglycan/xylan/chitin deacetylase (PgdA/CDA1 family)
VVSTVVSRLHHLPGRQFEASEPVVALSFDDGPGSATGPIADSLADLDVAATFFVVGSVAAESPEQVTRLADAGHTVGGHSWSHARGEAVDDGQLVAESVRTATLITELTGRPARFVRPPYRKADAGRYATLLDGRGFTIVTWSVDPRDWATSDPVEVARGVIDSLHCGAIVLLHDGGRDRSVTVDALPLIVHGARLAGYRFVTL